MPESTTDTKDLLSVTIAAPAQTKRVDFTNEYANNVFLESTAWDLKLVFGQADVSIGPTAVTQHTGVTIPWAQVKVLNYFLAIHLMSHENWLGRIHVPQGVIPEFPAPTDVDKKNFPGAEELYKKLCSFRENFLSNNPEAGLPVNQ